MPMSAANRRAAERWFLNNGLPSVLTRAGRWRGVWPRSAPVLAGFAALLVVATAIYFAAGTLNVDINGEPTVHEWLILALVMIWIPVGVITGWVVSLVRGRRARAVASSVSAGVAIIADAIPGDIFNFSTSLVGLAVIPLLTASGLGSILGWALRLAVSQFGQMGQLMLRALPVVLLTVLVFFNSPVWLMASTISRPRLWAGILFLGAIAAVFLTSSTLERVRPLVRSHEPASDAADKLVGTPFESMNDPATAEPLRRGERFNVAFVVSVTQVAQVLTVAIVTTLIFCVLGLILVSPALLGVWTRNPVPDGKLFWMTIPVPNALIQITMFLGALTFMYLSARAVSDREYRSEFVDPLLDDLHLTLVARNRYRAAVGDV